MNKNEKRILILLSMAQLILTLDSTVMNVSISALVKDLDTTISGVQGAITFYTLVMAAFMITGAKIGDIIGRKKTFIIGLIIYGIGSGITAIAPNIQVLKFGWSLLEGIGAALIIPAMISLIASNFKAGTARIKAYGTLAAMAAVGAGIGPIIGGLLTTYASWRYCFAGEVLIVAYVLFRRQLIVDAKLEGKRPKLDWLGAGLTALGMATMVQGILMASTYSVFRARTDFVVNNKVILEAGQISPSILLIIIGAIIMGGFVLWQRWREAKKLYPLVHLRLFMNKIVRSGLGTIFTQYFLLGGVMFALALFLQVQLQYDALKTGITMLPISLMILVMASRGSIMASKFAPRSIIRAGFGSMIIGTIWLGLRAGQSMSGWELVPTLALAGAGIGIISSQLQNLVQNSVTTKDSAETSGLMATFQNLGMSFGTAMSGVIMVSVLLFTSHNIISENSELNSTQKQQLTAAYEQQSQIVSNQQVEKQLTGQSPEVTQTVLDINSQVSEKSLSYTFILLALASGLGLLSTVNLPAKKPAKALHA